MESGPTTCQHQPLLHAPEDPWDLPPPGKSTSYAPSGHVQSVSSTGRMRWTSARQTGVGWWGDVGREEAGEWGGHVQSVRGGELAQPISSNPRQQPPAPYLPAGPLCTRTVLPQEAGGVLGRVERERQGAVGPKPGPQEQTSCRGPPRKGVKFRASVTEVVSKRTKKSKCQIKITPDRPVFRVQRANGRDPPKGLPQRHLPFYISVQGKNPEGLPHMI